VVVVVVVAIVTHVPVASPSIFYKAISMDNKMAKDSIDKKVLADIEQDVDRDIDRDVEHVMEKARRALNKTINTDIFDESTKLKLREVIAWDMKRNLSKYIEKDTEKAVANEVERDIKLDDSPTMNNYVTSGEIDIPSLHDPKLKKQFASAWPSLFCWCIMMTVGNNPIGWMEETLVKQQLDRSIGIFACNEWAVITDDRLALDRWGAHGFPKIPEGIEPYKGTTTWAIGSTQVAKGVETNPLNTMIFRTAWKALQTSKRLEHHDWVVKVDPDTVWFPVRLRSHLKIYMPGHGNGWDNVFLKNCQRYNSMQGPVEVISRKAATNLQNNIQNCGGVWGTGEDHFMVACLQQLGVSAVMEAGLLNDKYCDGYVDCSNTWKVAFHPHKNPKRFMACYNTSMKVDFHQEK